MATLYWHDYETWGVDPSVDRPAQFAGVRTDLDLNIIGDPLVCYCKPVDDVLPHPEACLVTGIAPQKALQEGDSEASFIAKIHAQLAQPGTIGVGYNSIRFDDEVTRYTLYRNFYDPYEREWANGNGRWDIIDMVRLCYALRPEGIEWPMVDAKPSFRLELLTAANGLTHGAAHDAYSDVEATIQLAALVKKRQPALFEHVFKLRHKNDLRPLFDWSSKKPLLHISSKIPAQRGCTTLIMPLAIHPTNKNAVIVYDLTVDPQPLLELSDEDIHARVFSAQHDLPEGEDRIPLKLVHLNKCPVLLTPKLLTEKIAARLSINLQACWDHWQKLRDADLKQKVQSVMTMGEFDSSRDAERNLYGGFIPKKDQVVMKAVREADAATLASQEFIFEDPRLRELLWRYKARNFPTSLSEDESRQWFEFCRQRLKSGEDGILSIDQLKETIREIDTTRALDKQQKIVLQQLFRYAEDKARQYQVGSKCRW